MGFFKAYDMRGTFGVDFTFDTVRAVGMALPGILGAKKFLIGRDMRLTSRRMRDALVAGLISAGAEIDDLGLASTPMVYFFTERTDCDASVQITASHNPACDNGMKVSFGNALPVGYSNGLDRVEKAVAEILPPGVRGLPPPPVEIPPAKNAPDAKRLAEYTAWLKERATDFSGLRFAVDCSNGMASIFAHALFGEGPLYLNDTLDGTFPAHSPNPLSDEGREQISRAVREQKLDLGIVFDGDADRVMFVDGDGKFVQPDYLIPVVARRGLAEEPGAAVIHDVRTSRAAIETLRGNGARTVMGKVGHAFAKPLMRAENALCGGELAGHYYFREFAGCDSGALAAVKILDEAAESAANGVSFTGMMRPIVSKYANSGEMNFKVADMGKAVNDVLKTARSLSHMTAESDIDGYRLEFEEGWVSIRKSNTEPYLRLIAETDTPERLARWKAALCETAERNHP